MGSVNKVTLLGNLGKDPEVHTTAKGGKITTLSVATSEVWNNRETGEKNDRTEWHKVVIYNEKLGEVATRFLKKGSKVYLEGSLQTRKWTDQSGAEKYTTEVVLRAFKGDLILVDTTDEKPVSKPAARPANKTYLQKKDELDDEIPF